MHQATRLIEKGPPFVTSWQRLKIRRRHTGCSVWHFDPRTTDIRCMINYHKNAQLQQAGGGMPLGSPKTNPSCAAIYDILHKNKPQITHRIALRMQQKSRTTSVQRCVLKAHTYSPKHLTMICQNLTACQNRTCTGVYRNEVLTTAFPLNASSERYY